MKKYNEDTIANLFFKMQYNNFETIFMHSALQNLGKFENVNFSSIPSRLLEIFMSKTKNGALLMPAYEYSFPSKRYSDLQSQPSTVGILTEQFRFLASSRSGHPIFSVLGSGARADIILQTSTPEYNPFGENSVFGRMHRDNALVLFFGASIQVCTYMVYCEAMLNVKYRYFKSFSGTLRLFNGESVDGDFWHFCFPPNNEIVRDYSIVFREMMENGIVQSIDFGMGKVYWFRAGDFFHYVDNALQKNPWILLKTPPSRIWGIEGGVEKVLEELNA